MGHQNLLNQPLNHLKVQICEDCQLLTLVSEIRINQLGQKVCESCYDRSIDI